MLYSLKCELGHYDISIETGEVQIDSYTTV